ncbi:MAG: hypothetical protein C0395_07250 [Gemmatimonas sp.]|nr:hypothetical protein [Gemmatimonas sp.]
MTVTWNTMRRRRFPALGGAAAVLWLLAGAGCGPQGGRPLRLSDLTPSEHAYVTRFVTLERARAVALVDRGRGEALLDSLAVSWGDSSLASAQAALPADPRRQALLHGLLGRILRAEQDSLLDAARPDRLGAPLPDPAADAAGANDDESGTPAQG